MSAEAAELPTTSYIAEPTAAPKAAVIVVHDWFGLLDHVRRACESLAGAGFLAVAPDLYDGKATIDPAQAEQLLGGLDEPAAIQMLRSLVATLQTRNGVLRVGAIGFSVGGSMALSIADVGVAAAVAYYGTGEPKDVSRIRCPVLGHFAEEDEWPATTHPGGYVDEYFSKLRGREATPATTSTLERSTRLRTRTWRRSLPPPRLRPGSERWSSSAPGCVEGAHSHLQRAPQDLVLDAEATKMRIKV